MATTLNHTGFVVRNLERSVRFYTDGLGLNVDKNLDIDGEGLSQVVGYEKTHLKAALLTGDDGTHPGAHTVHEPRRHPPATGPAV